jgi:hypothetical protein
MLAAAEEKPESIDVELSKEVFAVAPLFADVLDPGTRTNSRIQSRIKSKIISRIEMIVIIEMK